MGSHARQSGIDPYPEFVHREDFSVDEDPHWFVAHMSKATVKIPQEMERADVILEVRDCRAPLSTVQTLLGKEIKQKQRLVVLNKVDLVTPRIANRAQAIVEDSGLPCIAVSAKTHRSIGKIREWAMSKVHVRHPTIGLWMMVMGFPNLGKSTLINGMKRLSFSAAKHARPSSQMMHGEHNSGIMRG